MTKGRRGSGKEGVLIVELLFNLGGIERVESGRRRSRGRALGEAFHLCGHLSHFLGEEELFVFDGHQSFLEDGVLLLDGSLFAFEFLHFLSLPLSGRLGGGAVAQHSLNTALLFLIIRLCSFPGRY